MSMDSVIDRQKNGNTMFTGLLITFAVLALSIIARTLASRKTS